MAVVILVLLEFGLAVSGGGHVKARNTGRQTSTLSTSIIRPLTVNNATSLTKTQSAEPWTTQISVANWFLELNSDWPELFHFNQTSDPPDTQTVDSLQSEIQPMDLYLNLTLCFRRLPLSPARDLHDGDTLQAYFALPLDKTDETESCSLIFFSKNRAHFITTEVETYTVTNVNGECVGINEVMLNVAMMEALYPCRPPRLFSDRSNMVNIVLSYSYSKRTEALFLSLKLRFHLSESYHKNVLSHAQTTPHSGLVTTFRFDGKRWYSNAVDVAVGFLLSDDIQQFVMITFKYFDIRCDDTIKFYELREERNLTGELHVTSKVFFMDGISGKVLYFTLLWIECGKRDIPSSVHNGSVLVRLKTEYTDTATGFKLLYSFHNQTEAPEMLGSGLYNCSVPYYERFQQHLACNMKVECQDMEDEVDCPYNTDACGPGLFDMGNKCLKYEPVSSLHTWYDANEFCMKYGMSLVTPKTPEEWNQLEGILDSVPGTISFFIGLHTSSLFMGHMYRQVWRWTDNTVAYYSHVSVGRNTRMPACAYFDRPKGEKVLPCRCNEPYTLSAILCETEKYVPSVEGGRMNVSSNADFTKVNGSTEMVKCSAGHYTKDFLSCDLLSHCDAEGYLTSCHTPAVGEIPMFYCDNGGQTVPYTLVCDHRQDCTDGSDETFCVFDACPDRQCGNQQCVTSDEWCDSVPHCVDGSDEECEIVMSYNIAVRNVSPPAIVTMDGRGGYSLTPLNSSQNCPASHVRCSDGYCLPVYLRCNGVWDCLDREDETDCDSYTCPGFYRCRASTVCVHADNVCDGVFHCPQQDDELLCDLLCPENCRCQGLSFICTGPFPVDNLANKFIRYLDASGTGTTPDDLKQNIYLNGLRLSSCGLQSLGPLTFPNLKTLDVSSNNLTSVDTRSFRRCPHLHTLRLSDNPIHLIQRSEILTNLGNVHRFDLSRTTVEVFDGSWLADFPGLTTFNLSHSSVRSITGGGFVNIPHLETLDLRGAPVEDFPVDLLQNLLQLKTVYASSYKICCPTMLPSAFNVKNCHAPKDIIASCDDLLRSNVYRVCLWTMSVLALVGNAASLVTRLYIQKQSALTSFTVFVTSLNVADLLMGVYLVIIGVADLLYLGVYLWKDQIWKGSVVCRVAGFLSLVSSEMSAFQICLITLDRFLALRFVFSGFRFNKRSAFVSCGLLWIIAFSLGIIPFLPMTSHWNFYGQNGICIPLPVTSSSFPGYSYSFGVMIVLNMSLFLLIAVGQVLIYRSVQQNSFSSDKQSSKEKTIARRLTTIVLSDFMCWFPIAVLGVLASRGTQISSEVSVFTAIFVMPLNAALNPFLYTLNIVLEKRKKAVEARLLDQLAKQLNSSRKIRSISTMTTETGGTYEDDTMY